MLSAISIFAPQGSSFKRADNRRSCRTERIDAIRFFHMRHKLLKSLRKDISAHFNDEAAGVRLLARLSRTWLRGSRPDSPLTDQAGPPLNFQLRSGTLRRARTNAEDATPFFNVWSGCCSSK